MSNAIYGEMIPASRNGKDFRVIFELNSGVVTIYSADAVGYKSAHRTAAAIVFRDKRLVKEDDTRSWCRRDGVKVVSTKWHAVSGTG